jgi:hypothetical protein
MTSPADITFTLHRQSGSTFVTAAEVVAFAETASVGTYVITFTPQQTGLYLLQLTELNANSLQRTARFSYEILPAGAVFSPAFSNAFCSESDIERYAGLSFTSSSTVTSNEASAFAEERAAVLASLCNYWRFAVTPASVVVGSRLEDLLRAANAIGAALDAVIAWYQNVEPSENQKAVKLLDQWIRLIGGTIGNEVITGTLETEIIASLAASLATNHTLSGDTTPRASDNAPVDVGFQIRMTDLY